MKAIISTTYDDKYLYFLPIVTWAWNKLGVDVVCFIPHLTANVEHNERIDLLMKTERELGLKLKMYQFEAPEHKQATYAQCSRLYGACLDLPEDEVIITSDIDMLMFRLPEMMKSGFSIFGSDLVPEKQYPMCYISAKVKDWRNAFNLTYGALSLNPVNSLATEEVKTYQQCLDELMEGRDSISMRSDFWALDQEIAFNKINLTQEVHYISRTNGQNQFATHRLDRDDSFLLDRMNSEVYDYHANRPPYEENNFEKILTVLEFFYPEESFEWLVEYQNSYVNLLNG